MSLIVGRHRHKNLDLIVTKDSKIEDFEPYFKQYPELKNILLNDNDKEGSASSSESKVKPRQVKSK